MSFVETLLGQANPGAVNTTLYTVPALKSGIMKTMVVCNTGALNETFRIFVDPTGTSFAVAHAQYYDVPIQSKQTIVLEYYSVISTPGGSVGIFASSTDVVFTLYGAENT